MLNKKFKKNKFDFVKNFKWFTLFSGIIIAFGVLVISIWGLNLGIDFTGGSILEIEIGNSIENNSVFEKYSSIATDKLETEGFKIASVQRQESGGVYSVVICFQDIKNKNKAQNDVVIEKLKVEIVDLINAEDVNLNALITTSERIPPRVSDDFVRNTIFAILGAIVLVMIYVFFRFELFSVLSIIIALAHDVLFMLAICAFFRLKINSIFFVAIVAVICYSILNSILLFAKVRENWRLDVQHELTYKEIVNKSIMQSVSKIIYINIVILITLILFALFGMMSIREFVLPILFGVIGVTYCLIFITTSAWSYIAEKRKIKFRVKKSI